MAQVETGRARRTAEALRELGFAIIHVEEDEAVVEDCEDSARFSLVGTDSWVQAGQILLDSEEIQASKYGHELGALVLRIHSRFLGCRFGLDEQENLVVQYDIYPEMDSVHIAVALRQMAYVAVNSLPLFHSLLHDGEPASEDQITLALTVPIGSGQ